MSRLKEKYQKEIRGALNERFKYANSMLIPEIKKIVINIGAGEASKDKNAMQDCINELTMISGQKPILTKAKKSVANFKTREGQVIGLKVTLRRKRMYDFIDRFCNIVSPRIRDFRGFAYKCDGRGNYSVGISDQQVFPELKLDDVKRTQGMHITFVTSAQTDEECYELLKALGVPFKEKK